MAGTAWAFFSLVLKVESLLVGEPFNDPRPRNFSSSLPIAWLEYLFPPQILVDYALLF